VLRDFERLSGHLHHHKVDIAKAMLEMCAALGCKGLLACSSTSAHASQDLDHIARDSRKLATLAPPLGIKIAYEGLLWGRTINEFTTAWDVVCRADCPNLGLGVDSFHIFAVNTPLEEIDYLDPSISFLVQLADFMWQETRTFEERMSTARTFRVFPGEGVHSDQLVDLVQKLDRRSALWLAEDVLHRCRTRCA
jgi:4-hydroxyphenylpyruvate dioxygenase